MFTHTIIEPTIEYIRILNEDGSLYTLIRRDLIDIVQRDVDEAYYLYLSNAAGDWIKLTAKQAKQVLEQLS